MGCKKVASLNHIRNISDLFVTMLVININVSFFEAL